jgi:hypothetical protein
MQWIEAARCLGVTSDIKVYVVGKRQPSRKEGNPKIGPAFPQP